MNDEKKREEATVETEVKEIEVEVTDAQPEEHQEAAEEQAEPTIDQWREALEMAVKQRDEYLALAQRAQADYQNFKRRNQQTRTEAYDDGARETITALLPVLDNLERALSAAQVTEGASLLTGVEMILKQMRDIYTKMGVTEVNRLGAKFDPNVENAVMQGSPDEGEPGTVCTVLQKGYVMGKTVLREAMVKVVPD